MTVSSHPNHEVKGNRPEGKGRGASNSNDRGNTTQRRKRKEWLVETYRADRDLIVKHPGEPWPIDLGSLGGDYGQITYSISLDSITVDVPIGKGQPACRCYRCGKLLTVETVTVDKIFTRLDEGTYRSLTQDRRERATNIRPACNDCQVKTGAPLASRSRAMKSVRKEKK